jgi:hypothetical protein
VNTFQSLQRYRQTREIEKLIFFIIVNDQLGKMYVFIEETQNYGNRYVWFYAEGRSKYEVATMYQRKQLDKRYIKKQGKKMIVGFGNMNGLSFEKNEEYFLHTIPSRTAGIMHVKLFLIKNQHVGASCRMPTEPILQTTWGELMPRDSEDPYELVPVTDTTMLLPQKYKKIFLPNLSTIPEIASISTCPSEDAEYGPLVTEDDHSEALSPIESDIQDQDQDDDDDDYIEYYDEVEEDEEELLDDYTYADRTYDY